MTKHSKETQAIIDDSNALAARVATRNKIDLGTITGPGPHPDATFDDGTELWIDPDGKRWSEDRDRTWIAIPDNGPDDCRNCDGQGTVDHDLETGKTDDCATCNGTGKRQPEPLTEDSANELCQHSGLYDERCQAYERLGMTRSDAQGVVDAEIIKVNRNAKLEHDDAKAEASYSEHAADRARNYRRNTR